MKTGELAERLERHPNTVRNWTERYADYLSPGLASLEPGAIRNYSEQDALILATVASLSDLGVSPERIEEALEKGQIVESLPERATPEEEEARRNVELIPLPNALAETRGLVARIEAQSDEIERLAGERDRERESREQTQERLAETREEIGLLRGRLEMIILTAVLVTILLAAVVGLAVALFA